MGALGIKGPLGRLIKYLQLMNYEYIRAPRRGYFCRFIKLLKFRTSPHHLNFYFKKFYLMILAFTVHTYTVE